MGKNALKCCTWNIRRGLVTREPELRILLKSEDIDVIFLTETDTKNTVNEDSYTIEGYKTILPLKSISNNLTRILCLVKENLVNAITVRADLMNEEFPSIWIEYKQERKKSTLLAGFYRVWTQEGDKTHGEQLARIKVFNEQIDKASDSKSNIIIMGDANLCSDKWFSTDFGNKKVAKSLQCTLERCGLKIAKIVNTFQSDHLKSNGAICESANICPRIRPAFRCQPALKSNT